MELYDKAGNKVADMATNEDIRAALGLKPMAAQRGREGASGAGGRRNSVGARDPAGRRASVAKVTSDVASLFDGVTSGDIDAVTVCLEQGVPIDSLDDDSNTPLIIAAEGEPGILEMLIERGANVDLQNKHGVTALVHWRAR